MTPTQGCFKESTRHERWCRERTENLGEVATGPSTAIIGGWEPTHKVWIGSWSWEPLKRKRLKPQRKAKRCKPSKRSSRKPKQSRKDSKQQSSEFEGRMTNWGTSIQPLPKPWSKKPRGLGRKNTTEISSEELCEAATMSLNSREKKETSHEWKAWFWKTNWRLVWGLKGVCLSSWARPKQTC